jgi:hypothetical protein
MNALLPLVLGLVDGILNALTLAAGSLLGGSGEITIGLSLCIRAAAFAIAALAFFVANYAELRRGLVRAGRQLSLRADRRLPATDLGRIATVDSLAATGLACSASFLGAALPLLAGAVLRGFAWLAICSPCSRLASSAAAWRAYSTAAPPAGRSRSWPAASC